MSILVNRATRSQRLILRIVDGAARNAADAHPKWPFDRRLANSIAKRAAGTLMAHGFGEAIRQTHAPDVLAVTLEGGSSDGAAAGFSAGGGSGGVAQVQRHPRRGASIVGRRASLCRLHAAIGALAGEARRAGQWERVEALADALRLIAKQMEDKRA